MHIFFLGILMLNFMIAILTMAYRRMRRSGDFMYKCTLFQYCERYQCAFLDPAYGDLVMHSAPINILCVLLLPFIPSRKAMERISGYFSILVFWVENIMFIASFVAIEIFLIPFSCVIISFNLFFSSETQLLRVVNVTLWFFLWIPILALIFLRDVFSLIWILAQHDGCKSKLSHEIPDEEMPRDKQIDVFNNLRVAVIQMYCKIKNDSKEFGDNTSTKVYDHHDVLGMLEEDESVGYEPGLFSVKLTAVREFWKKQKIRSFEDDEEDSRVAKKKKKEKEE